MDQPPQVHPAMVPEPSGQEASADPSTDPSPASSKAHSRQGSGHDLKLPKEKHRVHFDHGHELGSSSVERPPLAHGRTSSSPSRRGGSAKPLPLARNSALTVTRNQHAHGPRPHDENAPPTTDSPPRSTPPRPARGMFSLGSPELEDLDEDEDGSHTVAVDVAASEKTARDRAERLSRSLVVDHHSRSAPGSKLPSPAMSPPLSPITSPPLDLPLDMTNIPLKDLGHRRKKFGIEDDTDSEDEHASARKQENLRPKQKRFQRFTEVARRLIPSGQSTEEKELFARLSIPSHGLTSGQVTPLAHQSDLYLPRPKAYRPGILGKLLKLNGDLTFGSDVELGGSHRSTKARSTDTLLDGLTPAETPLPSPTISPTSSGHGTPKRKGPKWFEKGQVGSSASLSSLVNSSTVLAGPASTSSGPQRPGFRRPLSATGLDALISKSKHKHKVARHEQSIHIQIHIQETLARQKYLVRLCRALMSYGAPTHRLEEYMRMSARVLEIEIQVLYIPGCMLISFDDQATHTTEVKIVRSSQGVDLGKLRDMHEIYKEVVHDIIGVKEASERLDELARTKVRYGPWTLVFFYGLASAFVAPFAFSGRMIDMPVVFFLGCLLGVMQLILAPRSDLYANVFEISAAVVTSFLARAFGSINGGQTFCFSALAQSSIALILPGYAVLCGALELQSKNIVAGSVRMVYAIIYSLFLGFGITIGTAFYGAIDHHATEAVTCSDNIAPLARFAFVPIFTLCLVVINQAKWQQAPVMIVIAFAGYVVNYFSSLRFASNVQVANTLGALAIGVLGNLYSRFWHGLSAAALLPAIFVQVPSGLAASGSLISGITSAEQIINNTTAPAFNSTNGTTTVSGGVQAGQAVNVNNVIFNVGYSMIQVAIGITVGLFLSSLLIYPFGKRRSGLFSF